MLPDGELLRRYVEKGEQTAFAELVQRHCNFAYRTALRSAGGNAHTADDVVQKVFTDLARKARTLARHPNLAGWIHVSVRFAATDAVRAEQRRHIREKRAMDDLNGPAEKSRERLEPWFDEVLDALPARDREVLVLHYFEERSFPEIGSLLAMNADAARMRVNRALERLRLDLSRRALVSSAAVLGETLLAQSAVAAGLPPAPAVAARAIEQAVKLGPAGGSIMAQGLQGIRSLPAIGWIAGTVIVGGLIYHGERPGGAAPASLRSPAAAEPMHVTTEAPVEELVSSPEEPATRVVNPTTMPAGFADLTMPEKRILKILWSRETEFGNAPGRRWAIAVSPDKPKYRETVEARRALRLRGWVAVNRNGAIFFTDAGLAYCREQRKAIDAFPMPPTRPEAEIPAGKADQ